MSRQTISTTSRFTALPDLPVHALAFLSGIMLVPQFPVLPSPPLGLPRIPLPLLLPRPLFGGAGKGGGRVNRFFTKELYHKHCYFTL